MNTAVGIDRCFSFVNCQLQAPKSFHVSDAAAVKCITVSRESGCGAHAFALELAEWLQTHLPHGPAPWTVFDRTLVQAVLEDHHLPSRLAAFMPEDRVSQLDDIIHDLFKLHPPMDTLARQTSETILRLAELGNVIIVGRGANIITAHSPHALHVRLVGSMEQRAAHLRFFDKLGRREALARIEQEDGGRRRYLKWLFGKDIDDPMNYHLIINTDWVTLGDAAAAVGGLALRRQMSGSATVARAAA